MPLLRLPRPLALAFTYYSDTSRVLAFLPHIRPVQAYAPNQFRMLYSTTELGAYHIRIFWDIWTTLDTETAVIRVSPLEGIQPVTAMASVNSSVAQGCYFSESVFHDEGDQTRIEYWLELQAELPTPLGMRLVTGKLANRIAQSITQGRIHEIAEGFVERSIEAFPCWLAEMEAHRVDVIPGMESAY
ncbi:MAG: hypothetical protein KKA73_26775 [Chloroflexi bacterium]|nr:hypothetical protein [Chloroflexota bacterium]MBU1751305.1 hypothetical protein [Chloroflexota bacterium]